MLRAVIDTNCLLASLNRSSPYHRLYQLFVSEAFEWVLSNEILTEYEEVLTNYYAASTANRVVEILLSAPNSHFQEAYYKLQLIDADPDDNKFVDVAVAANADLLVTNDRHFGVLQQISFPKIQTITLQEFIKLYDEEPDDVVVEIK